MTSQVAVSCDGARLPRAVGGADWTRLDIRAGHGGGPYNLRIPVLSAKLQGNVPHVAIDLLRIGAFVYWADQEIERKAELDVFGQLWNRRFVVAIPVEDPALWSSADVRLALERAVGFGTDDRWQFHFTPAGKTDDEHLFAAGTGVAEPPDSVLLFSGGTDSLCAAAKEALAGRKPLLVSHSPSPRLKGQQREVVRSLTRSELGWTFPALQAEVSKTGNPERERTQRSRGFLYSAIGAAVAASLGVRDVILADNGFVSIGLPLSGQAAGGKMSRTTHPRFQKLFNDLLGAILPGTRIRNPLLYSTRSELLGSLEQPLLEGLAATRSCAAGSRLSDDAPHCGRCSQCVDRRVGMIAAGLSKFDTPYVTDIFTDDLSESQVVFAEGYLRLMRKIRDATPIRLSAEFLELSDCATLDENGASVRMDLLAEMACRQSDAFLLALEIQATKQTSTLVSGSTSRNSLLALAIAPAGGRRRALPTVTSMPASLSDLEEEEAVTAGFGCRLPVVITGRIVNRASNQVLLADVPVNLPDADMKLFLRLVLELKRSAEGWCSKESLVSDGYSPPDVENALRRLRRCLVPGLGAIDPLGYIQTRAKRVRISSHPRLVEVSRAAFAGHPNFEIRTLVSQIPSF